MKSLVKIYTLLTLITFISCNKLDLNPVNSIGSNNFYTSSENLEAGLYGIYDALQLSGMFDYQILLDGMSDNGIAVFNFAPDVNSYAKGQQVEVTNLFRRIYLHSYVLIQRANLLLDNAGNISGVTPSELGIVIAEARTLRALAYMRLAYFYGDVPFYTTAISRDEALKISRTGRDVVIDFVITEFTEAAQALGTSSINGRLTKQAVLGLHARLMLYEARQGKKTWDSALSLINSAISAADSGGHGLVDTNTPENDYKSLFTESGEGNTEFIFSVKNNATDLGRSYKEDFSWQAGALRMYVHQNLADAYEYANGTDYNPADATYAGRDPRLSVNIMHQGLTFGGLTYDGTDGGGFVGANAPGTATNLFVYKFITTDFVETFNEGSLDIPVLRYADLLLMQAEALNETGGDGHNAINLVRDRAGLPALSGLSKSDLRDKIIHERRVELAFEGQRWFDLITLGIAERVINGIVEENANIIRGFTPNRNELIPIPQREIEANPNLLPQNPGY